MKHHHIATTRSHPPTLRAATPRPPQTHPDGTALRSFRGLLDHLATLTRDRIRYQHSHIEIDKLTDPTPDQRRAFDLINSPIPLTISA